MNVKELSQEQLDVLKQKVYYASDDELGSYYIDDEILKDLDNSVSWWHIDNETIYKIFDSIYFVEDDFPKQEVEEIEFEVGYEDLENQEHIEYEEYTKKEFYMALAKYDEIILKENTYKYLYSRTLDIELLEEERRK